jgi:hypothetical protein
MAAPLGSRVSRAAAAGTAVFAMLLILLPSWNTPRAGAGPQGASATSNQQGASLPKEQDKPLPEHDGKASPKQRPVDPRDEEDDSDDTPQIDPLGPNAACYVCHMTFVFEELAKVHLAEKTTCIDCHGLSAAHANDEHIGATKPDITYKRDQIDPSCEKCHEEHDVPATKVIARFLERKPAEAPASCTDCHGTHKIERPEGEGALVASPAQASP